MSEQPQLFETEDQDGNDIIQGPKLVKKDLTTALQLCNDLISFKGIASGIALAREITNIYSTFDTDQKLSFFKEINNRFPRTLGKNNNSRRRR